MCLAIGYLQKAGEDPGQHYSMPGAPRTYHAAFVWMALGCHGGVYLLELYRRSPAVLTGLAIRVVAARGRQRAQHSITLGISYHGAYEQHPALLPY
jgi:hypothetical protein